MTPFEAVFNALQAALPGDPPDVIARAAEAALLETGRPPLPAESSERAWRRARVTSAKGCNIRAQGSANARPLGTLVSGAGFWAGQSENGWTPGVILFWIGDGMIGPELSQISSQIPRVAESGPGSAG